MGPADNEVWRGKAGLWLMLTLAVIAAAWLGFCEMQANTISFDGALNAQVAANLLKNGHYGIGYPEIQDFDHRVQTGPTVVLPVALSFALFGVGSEAAQLPNLIFFVLFLALVVRYTFRHAGPAGALLALLMVLQTPQLVPIGLGIYGEIPALAFFLAALLLLDRFEATGSIGTAAVSGVFFGLSVLTKIVMLIPVSATFVVILIGVALRRNLPFRAWAYSLGGFTLPLAAFEAARFVVLGPRIWVQWWLVMIRRIAGQGLPSAMADTAGAVPKLETHLGILSHDMNVHTWPVLLLIAVPTLGFLLLWRRDRAAKPTGSVALSVVSLWLAATFFFAWWLLLTPTSRAWLRRILDGLLLQEILASIFLVWAARFVDRSFRDHQFGSRRDSARIFAVGAAGCLLLIAAGTLVASNLPRLELSTQPTATRRAVDAMVATMRSLPDEAIFYGKGWYRAPVFALLSEREMRDFNNFPLSSYDKPLEHAYFVVDNHMLHYKPGEVGSVLERSISQTVYHSDVCALYRLDKVLPYTPLPEVHGAGDLSAILRPKDGDYPYSAGLGPEAPNGRFSHAVSGFLLDRDDNGCLVVDIWPSPQGGEEPRLEVRVDHQVVQSADLVVGRLWKQIIILGEDVDPETPGSLVELWMFTVRNPKRFSLWSSDRNTFVLREVGFVPCPDSGN